MNWNYFLIGVIFLMIIFAGCIEVEVEEGSKVTSTTISTSTTSTTLTSTTTLSTTITTTSTTTITTTLQKVAFSCEDYCKKEGYERGKCRKSPARCRRYGINEVYEPLGDKYCPKGTGYDACCCIFSPTTTTSSTSTTTLPEETKVAGFKQVRPLESSVKYKTNGPFSCKILNTVGVKIEMVNVSSKKCQVSLGSLDAIELEEGGETMLRARCDEKEEGENFTVNLNFTYKEILEEIEIYHQDSGIIQGKVKNEMS